MCGCRQDSEGFGREAAGIELPRCKSLQGGPVGRALQAEGCGQVGWQQGSWGSSRVCKQGRAGRFHGTAGRAPAGMAQGAESRHQAWRCR